jgi:hypothetical protein
MPRQFLNSFYPENPENLVPYTEERDRFIEELLKHGDCLTAGKELIAALREYQKSLEPDDRIALWDELSEGYCTFCGSKHPIGYYCQCSNDA